MSGRSKILAAVSAAILLAGGVFAWLSHRSASGTSLGQSVNAGIDNLVATGIRLLELPAILLLAGGAVMAVLLALPLMRWGTRTGRITSARVAVTGVAGIALMLLAIGVDYKLTNLNRQVAELRGQLNQEKMNRLQAMNEAPVAAAPVPPSVSIPATLAVSATAPVASSPTVASAPAPRTVPATSPVQGPIAATAPAASSPAKVPVKAAAKRDALLVDAVQVPRNLSVLFGQVGFHPMIHDEATDFVEVDMQNPQVIAYMAVVNLKTPGLEIKYGGSLTQKTLTSAFARTNNCQIAINGEAGQSPQANSGLGLWRGNMMVAGQTQLQETPSNKRPFLAFDKQSQVSFTAMAAADRTIRAGSFNVIWGRMDAIIDNQVQTENERDRQPRTAMGINQDGSKLYLMVVDGRQQQYSIGFTRQEVGAFLQMFGATNGMLCDEGGSSCIYIKKFNGIVNSPSDGVERPTYTHFGISLKDG